VENARASRTAATSSTASAVELAVMVTATRIALALAPASKITALQFHLLPLAPRVDLQTAVSLVKSALAPLVAAAFSMSSLATVTLLCQTAKTMTHRLVASPLSRNAVPTTCVRLLPILRLLVHSTALRAVILVQELIASNLNAAFTAANALSAVPQINVTLDLLLVAFVLRRVVTSCLTFRVKSVLRKVSAATNIGALVRNLVPTILVVMHCV
jgi:hypothetical protein